MIELNEDELERQRALLLKLNSLVRDEIICRLEIEDDESMASHERVLVSSLMNFCILTITTWNAFFYYGTQDDLVDKYVDIATGFSSELIKKAKDIDADREKVVSTVKEIEGEKND